MLHQLGGRDWGVGFLKMRFILRGLRFGGGGCLGFRGEDMGDDSNCKA